MECTFCDKKIKKQAFLETENFMAVPNISPVVQGHSLIIPKRHITKIFELTKKEIIEMSEITKKATKYLLDFHKVHDFNLIINQGKAAGQTIEHLHLHILPRKKNNFKAPHQPTLKVTNKKETKDRKILSDQKVKNISEELKEFISQQ